MKNVPLPFIIFGFLFIHFLLPLGSVEMWRKRKKDSYYNFCFDYREEERRSPEWPGLCEKVGSSCLGKKHHGSNKFGSNSNKTSFVVFLCVSSLPIPEITLLHQRAHSHLPHRVKDIFLCLHIWRLNLVDLRTQQLYIPRRVKDKKEQKSRH